MKRTYLVLMVAVAIAACSRSVEKAELPGIYRFEVENLRQELTIGADGTYVNTLYLDGKATRSDREVWAWELLRGDAGATFSGFRFGIPGHSAMPGYWFVVPEKSISGIRRLCFDPDLGRCFEAK